MLTGVYTARKKDGTLFYRSSITYKNKHISLGSYPSEELAADAYLDANRILNTFTLTPESDYHNFTLSFGKIISLLNFRDNGIYMKTPIYIRNKYFQYFLDKDTDLKFDIEDLFYYSTRTISVRGNHLYVSDYGMQVSLPSRYGIRNYAVPGKDFVFINGDSSDFRSSNLKIYVKYHGVYCLLQPEQMPSTRQIYKAKIHIKGDWVIGIYPSEAEAALAYNKAVDMAKNAGIRKNYPVNYIEEYTSKEYAEKYVNIPISTKYIDYLNSLMKKENPTT